MNYIMSETSYTDEKRNIEINDTMKKCASYHDVVINASYTTESGAVRNIMVIPYDWWADFVTKTEKAEKDFFETNKRSMDHVARVKNAMENGLKPNKPKAWGDLRWKESRTAKYKGII